MRAAWPLTWLLAMVCARHACSFGASSMSGGTIWPLFAATRMRSGTHWSCALKAAPQLEPKPRRWCLAGEAWPRGHASVPHDKQSDVERLTRRVTLLENLVHDICSALVYCDDVALVEREMLSAGDIFMDLSSNVTRAPLLLRRSVADLSRKHGRPVSPPSHSWH